MAKRQLTNASRRRSIAPMKAKRAIRIHISRMAPRRSGCLRDDLEPSHPPPPSWKPLHDARLQQLVDKGGVV